MELMLCSCPNVLSTSMFPTSSRIEPSTSLSTCSNMKKEFSTSSQSIMFQFNPTSWTTKILEMLESNSRLTFQKTTYSSLKSILKNLELHFRKQSKISSQKEHSSLLSDKEKKEKNRQESHLRKELSLKKQKNNPANQEKTRDNLSLKSVLMEEKFNQKNHHRSKVLNPLIELKMTHNQKKNQLRENPVSKTNHSIKRNFRLKEATRHLQRCHQRKKVQDQQSSTSQ